MKSFPFPSVFATLSEARIFASTNPKYDDILFIELQIQYVKILSSEHGENMLSTSVQKLILTFRTINAKNMFSPCSAKIRASDKDLPLHIFLLQITSVLKKKII